MGRRSRTSSARSTATARASLATALERRLWIAVFATPLVPFMGPAGVAQEVACLQCRKSPAQIAKALASSEGTRVAGALGKAAWHRSALSAKSAKALAPIHPLAKSAGAVVTLT